MDAGNRREDSSTRNRTASASLIVPPPSPRLLVLLVASAIARATGTTRRPGREGDLPHTSSYGSAATEEEEEHPLPIFASHARFTFPVGVKKKG